MTNRPDVSDVFVPAPDNIPDWHARLWISVAQVMIGFNAGIVFAYIFLR